MANHETPCSIWLYYSLADKVIRALDSLSKFLFLPFQRHSVICLICCTQLRYAITVTTQQNMIFSVFNWWLRRRSSVIADPWSVVHGEDRNCIRQSSQSSCCRIIITYYLLYSAVLQIGRSLVRSQLVSLEIFIDIKLFRSHYGPGVDSASNRNEYQEHFLGVKAAGA